jgi:VIT1/CCC1 family predicted Fe2+/Mn2+ transporter
VNANSEEKTGAKSDVLIANWKGELDSADLYRYLAGKEADARVAGLLNEMADAESRHARVMENSLREAGMPVPARHRRSFQTRALMLLARLFGPQRVYPLLHGAEISGSADYAGQSASTAALAPEERSHARTLGQLSGATHRGVAPGHAERWHRSGGGGSLRAAVFGVSDGLVSNLSLVMGFAGAAADSQFVLLAGLSGLLAGASSMAAGEYVSVRAQRELLERQIELEAAELSVSPQEEEEELALIYRAKGLPKAEADRIANRLAQDPEIALDSLVREELGLDPRELGSPSGAAISSFLSFAVGALVPVLPYFFGASLLNIAVSLGLSGAALFGVGATVSVFTGKSALRSGGRQLAIGFAAAAITFALGKIVGVSTG